MKLEHRIEKLELVLAPMEGVADAIRRVHREREAERKASSGQHEPDRSSLEDAVPQCPTS